MARQTEFSYECICGRAGPWNIGDGEVCCPACGHRTEVDGSGLLLLHKVSSNQTEYFNPIYAEGRVNVLDAGAANRANPYTKAVERATYFLKLCGVNTDFPTGNLSFLEIACGSGIVTAGLLAHPNLQHCRMHAFDLSTYGPAMLAAHAKTISTTSRLELSAQDAQDMKFAPESFDVIIGDAVLHHLDRYKEFLMKCRQLLKPGGVAIFGEPFAFGYALAAIALKLAQEATRISEPAIDAFYDNIGKRIRYADDAEFMIKMVDKHLFVPADLAQECQRVGLENIQFVSRQQGQYYSERFVGSILNELNVASPVIEEKARAIFKVIYDEFGETRFVDSMSAFMEVIMRRSEYVQDTFGGQVGRWLTRTRGLLAPPASLQGRLVSAGVFAVRAVAGKLTRISPWRRIDRGRR